jgi:hypothetical protein
LRNFRASADIFSVAAVSAGSDGLALAAQCDAIVTHNVRDFRRAETLGVQC